REREHRGVSGHRPGTARSATGRRAQRSRAAGTGTATESAWTGGRQLRATDRWKAGGHSDGGGVGGGSKADERPGIRAGGAAAPGRRRQEPRVLSPLAAAE